MQINRQKFLDTLTAVSPGLANKEVIEQSSCFVFKTNKVFTFNDEIAVCSETEVDLEGAIPAKPLHALLNKLKKDEIELEIMDGELRIKGSRAKAGIKMQEDVTIPIDEIGKPKNWISIPEGFMEGLKYCLLSCSSDFSTPVLTNILFGEDGLWSSNAYAISHKEMEFKESSFIPAQYLKNLFKYNPQKYTYTDGWIHFTCEHDVVYSCRIFEAEDSDFELFQSLQKNMQIKGIIIEFPKECEEILERVGIFSKTEFEQDEQIEVRIENEWVILRGEGEYGWFEEKARMKYDKDPILFHVSPIILATMLKHSHKMILGKNSMKFSSQGFEHVIYLEI